MPVHTKRVYEPAAPEDGYRVLVDRLWPRGVSKARLRLDDWNKSVAPSDALRRWFGHDPARWDAFKAAYFEELDKQQEAVSGLARRAGESPVTLLFAARDDLHNNAVALKEYLEDRASPPENTHRP